MHTKTDVENEKLHAKKHCHKIHEEFIQSLFEDTS